MAIPVSEASVPIVKTGTPARPDRWYLLPGSIFALCVARLWITPLGSSFWVDEMVTQFVVRHPNDPTLAVAPQVTDSVYYVLPRMMESWFGFSEIAYRIPSLIAMFIAALLIGKIAARLIHPAAGWMVVFLCMTLKDFNYEAADARPYALATCAVAASIWFLIRWLDRARWIDAALFAVAATLVWRVHLVLWPVYVLLAIYAAVRIGRGDTRVGWLAGGVVFAALGASLIPVLMTALALNRQAAEHVVVAIPGTGDLVNQLKFAVVGGGCAIAALGSRFLRWPAATRPIPWESLTLVLGWWICDPLCLFLYSVLSRNSVFLARYMYVALPGAALAGAAAIAIFLPDRYWRNASVMVGAGVLVLGGHWGNLRLAHHGSDWRGAAHAVNALGLSDDTPVICPSPFIEARPPVWRPDYPLNSFLYSHLLTYPVAGQKVPFPFEGSVEAGVFAEALVRGPLANGKRFALYGGDRAVKFWREWFEARVDPGVRSREIGSFGDVEVVVFEQERSPR